jgi:DNA-binding transcriptional ArsR family regulator
MDKRIKYPAKLCAIMLLMYSESSEGPTVSDLADMLDVDSRTITRWLQELKDAQLLRTRRTGRYNLYFLYHPDQKKRGMRLRHQDASKQGRSDPTITHDPRIRSSDTTTMDPTITHDPRIQRHDLHQDASKQGRSDPTILYSSTDGDDGSISHDFFYEEVESPSSSAPAKKPAKKPAIVGYLLDQGMGAAWEFANLDYESATADFQRRRKAGQSIPHIVRAWRINPPQPGQALAGAQLDQAPGPFSLTEDERKSYRELGFSLGGDDDSSA